MTSELKKQLCNELVENNLVKEGDMIYHSYTNNRLSGERDIATVQNKDTDVSATLTTRPDTLGIAVKDIEVCDFRYDEGLRDRKEKDIMPAINTKTDTSLSGSPMVKYNSEQIRIRKLTPKECIMLMGFDAEDYDKMAKVCSSSQIYKQAGNSIVVNVLEAIFRQML